MFNHNPEKIRVSNKIKTKKNKKMRTKKNEEKKQKMREKKWKNENKKNEKNENRKNKKHNRPCFCPYNFSPMNKNKFFDSRKTYLKTIGSNFVFLCFLFFVLFIATIQACLCES